MLTKKEYETIAGIIRNLPNRTTKEEVIDRFIVTLDFDNPNFDKDKFIKACSNNAGELETLQVG